MAGDSSRLMFSVEAQSVSIADPLALQQLQQALDGATVLLSDLPARADGASLLQQAFGSAGTADAEFQANLQALVASLQAEELQLTVELRSGAELGGALGAYAASGPDGTERIYLNVDWISAGASVEAIVRVLVEEAGHAIDQRLNPGGDSAGDEGELFAALVTGAELSDAQRAGILADQDHATLLIDGQAVEVEVAATALTSSTLGATSTTQAINRATAGSISLTVTYNATNNNGADILVAAFNGTTLIGWTIYNRSTGLDAGGGGDTATINVAFDLAQFNTDISSGGLTLKAWQGTASGSGNDDLSVKSSGTSTSVTFGVNSNSSSSTDLSTLAGGGSATWSNTTVDVTAPTKTVSITSITDDTGTSGDFITRDNNGLTVAASLSSALAAGEKLQYSNNNGSSWTDVSGTDISGTSVTRVDSGLTSTNTIQFRVVDAAGNAGTAASQLVTIDAAAPTVVITDDTAGVADGPVTFTFTFSEAVTGFTVDDITVGNGSKGTFTAVSSTVYTLVVTPTASTTGNITVDVAAGAASDAAGNASVAPTQYTQAFDTSALTVAISDNVAGTATGPVTFTFTFSEAVTGFTADDITVGNGSKGTFTAVSGTVYTLEVTPTAASSGNITIDVPADAATNGSVGNRAPAQYVQAFDTAAPTVVITDDAAGNASGPVTFTFTFSEAVTGFTADDITVGSGSKGTFTAVSSSVYTLAVTPSGTNGSITVDVAAAAASDAAGNASLAPQQYSQPFDTRAIRVTPGSYSLSSGVMSYELTTNGTGADLLVAVYADANGTSSLIGWQVVNRATAFTANAVYQGSFDFSAAQLARLEASTISIRAWQGTAGSNYGTGSNTTPGITYGTGTVAGGGSTGFRINSTSDPNGGTDPLVLTGTPSANSQLVSGITTVTVDTAAPTVVISDNIPGVTNGPVTFTFTFSEAVSGFTAADITVGNGSKGTFTAVSSTVYTLDVTPTPGLTGDITIDVAAGAATDAAGNASVAPVQYPQPIDSTPPGDPVITSAAATSATSAVISGTAEAGSTITITLGGATYTTTAALVTGAWSLNTASATATSGSLTLVGNDPIAVTATDAAGNVSGAATQTLAPEQLGAPDLIDASDTGASQTDNLTSDTTPTFSGLGANPGATVFLYNTTSGNLEGSGVADASGSWSITVDTSLTDGSYAFAVRQLTDASGNESPLSSPLTVTIDTTAPTAPANSLTLQNDSGTLNDGITRNVPAFGLGDLLTSALAAPQVLSAAPVATPIYGIGDIIQIGYLDENNAFVVSGASRPLTQNDFGPNGQLVQGNTTNGLGKSIQIALSATLPPGSYQFFVRVVDPAGNASDLSPEAFPVTLLDPADQPYINVLAAAVDPSGINVGTAVAGFYLYNPERLSAADLRIDFQDAADKASGYFEIDLSGSAIRLTAAGLQAYTDGLLSLPKDVHLILTGTGAPAQSADLDTAVLMAAAPSAPGSVFFIDFVDAWLGSPVDRFGRPLSGSNPNQYNYFKSSARLDASGTTFRFVAATDQSGAVGNNVLGTLYVMDAAGNQLGDSIQGVLSRVNKSSGDVQAVYFYEGTDYPTTSGGYDVSKKLVLLDLQGGRQYTSDTVYRTSSDLPRRLFGELTLDVNSVDVNEASSYAVFAVDSEAGEFLELALEDGGATGGGSSPPSDGSVDYRNDAFQYSLDNGLTWTDYSSAFAVNLTGGASKLLVRVALVNDDPYEGDHEFHLKVNYTGVGFSDVAATGTAKIHDDGTGDLLALDGSGNPLIDGSGGTVLDDEATKDDDRQLSVSGKTYNEGSAHIYWTVHGEAGLGIELLSLDGDPSGTALPEGDLSGNLEYFNGTDWVAFYGAEDDGGEDEDDVRLDSCGNLLIRKAIVNDLLYEGEEDFVLSVAYAKGGYKDASGTSSLIDDGTGTFVDPCGNIDPSGASLDDDRRLSVSGQTYNEGSACIYWTVQGEPWLGVTYRSLIGDPSEYAEPDLDLVGDLEYFDGESWSLFDASASPLLDGSGDLLIRKGVVNDSTFEGREGFVLSVGYTTGGFRDVSGVSFLIDDGTGTFVDASGTVDPSGVVLDDDRGLTVVAYGPFNEGPADGNTALPTLALFSIKATAGLELSLELGNTSSLLDKDATISGFTELQYSVDAGATWTAYAEGNEPTVPASGRVLVRVNISSEWDLPYEGPETFTLTATYTSGNPQKATGIATIIDNGTGDIILLDGSGNPRLDGSGNPLLDERSGVKNDDRSTLSIPDVIVNEASPYVVFQIFGAGGKTYRLALTDGAEDYMAPNDTGALGSQMAVGTGSIDPSGFDFRTELQIYNGSTWVPYVDASGVATASGASVLLVRIPLINDALYEAAHAFTLTATDISGNSPVSGRAIISDFGTGQIFNDSGNENRGAAKDDDRSLKVDSPIVNEASDFVVFRVRGITSAIELSLLFGNGTGFATLPTPDLHYWTGSAWQSYTAASLLTPGTEFSTGSELYVRVNISQEQDEPYEGFERFTLDVSGAGGPSQGVATIRDDGTGDIPAFDTSGNLLLDTSGNLILNTLANKDDDLDKDGIAPTTEDALSTLVSSQNVPGAKPGDLNGDGIADAEQTALATLAWRDVTSFNAGNEGTLTDYRPVISLIALQDASGSGVSNALQLQNIRVVDYNNDTEFPGGGGANIDASGTRTVSLASGGTVVTSWDPIRFELAPTNGVPDLTDVDPSRAGTQVRMFIDMRASDLDASTFNSYIKYVSREAIDASGDLLDLSGSLITNPGWYDFTQRVAGGDGARFVVNGGKITGIELILTDNAFGDNDPSLNRILDPGSPVFTPSEADLVPTEDGKGLRLTGTPGQSIWLDLSVLLSSAILQNSYNLIRRTYSGLSYVDAAVGAIGATAGAGFFGDTRLQLSVGEELRFALRSSNKALRAAPNIQISGHGNAYTIRLDDSDSTIDSDFNDLTINLRAMEENPLPLATQMAGLQTSMASPYLDLRWIPAQGVTLDVDVHTDNASRDVLRLVRLDPALDFHQDGSPKGTVSGVAPTAGFAFDRAVRNALLPFAHFRNGVGTSNLSLSLSQAQAGVYMPLLLSSSGLLYNAGVSSALDTWQRVRVLGANSFGFEAPSRTGLDWDFNDLAVNVRVAESTPRLRIGSGGRSLEVTGGTSGQGLWLDLSAVLSSSTWQNNLDLIKVSTSNQRSSVGSIGTTANATGIRAFGVYGSSTLFLETGESLEFRDNSNDNPVGTNPLLRITQVGERFVVAMDDRAGARGSADGDFNDLVLNIDSSSLRSNPHLDELTGFQLGSADGVLDLSGIDASGVRLQLQVSSDSLQANTLRFVRLDGGEDNDPLTNLSVNGTLFSASPTAFRSAVRGNLVGPVVTARGSTSQTVFWDVTTPGFYAPVLISAGHVFTLGNTTAVDGRQHLKLLGDNTFGFEELLSTQRSDFDYNDLTVQVQNISPLV